MADSSFVANTTVRPDGIGLVDDTFATGADGD